MEKKKSLQRLTWVSLHSLMELEPFINTLSVGKVTTITQVKALCRNKGLYSASSLPVDMGDPDL